MKHTTPGTPEVRPALHPIRRMERQVRMPTIEILSLIVATIFLIALLNSLDDDQVAR